MSNASDLFSKGCLVVLETGAWGARVKIPSKSLLNGSHEDVDPTFVGASKRLVDGKSLRDVEAIRGEARAWLYSRSLPFPLDGAVFVPVDAIEGIDAELVKLRDRFDAAADAFADEYSTLRNAARDRLGSLYSERDYPETVRERFRFSWRFLSLAPADEKVLSPALVEQERAKFQALMSEAADAAVTELRTRFAAVVDHAVERLSGDTDGKPKVFRDTLIGNIKGFIDSFASLNVLGDKDLEDLVKKARAAVEGVDASDLRSDEGLRARVAARLAEASQALDGMIVDRPSRKIKIAPAKPAPKTENDAA